MSRPSPNAQHSQPQNYPPDLPNVAALAEKLQETAQALLAFCKGNAAEQAEPAKEATATLSVGEQAEDDGNNGESGETRCYHFSPMTLRNERALLEKYDVEDFRGLLCEAHISFMGLTELMKNIEPEIKINSTVVYSLGCLLERASNLVFQIQDAYSTLELVEL